jgi:hypothetical protein
VDAIDYQGKCYSGTIVALEEVVDGERGAARGGNERGDDDGRPSSAATDPPTPSNGGERRKTVKVRFDNFAPKWDEWYDAASARLCPEGSLTSVRAKLSPFRNRFKVSSASC